MPHKTLNILVGFYIFVSCTLSASADVWHDDFDTHNPEAWNVVGNDAVWKISNGFLRAEVDRDWNVQYELYQFIAIPPPYRDFVIKITNFGGDKTRFGFCVGRSFPDTPGDDPFFYVFFPDEIRARRFDGKGSSHPFRFRLSREPRIRWQTDVLTQMELYFNSGHFVLFANGAFRTAFQDANFDKIEILGFVMEGINIANEWVGEAWVDAFTISVLTVTPQVKLTAMWSELKIR